MLELIAAIDQTVAPALQPPTWRAIERLVRQSLADWRALLLGDVARARDAFRKLPAGAIQFTPFAAPDGRGLRFEGESASRRYSAGKW